MDKNSESRRQYMRQYMRKWYAKNRGWFLKQKKEERRKWRAEHRELDREMRRKWAAKNRDRVRAYGRAYRASARYAQSKERRAAVRRDWYARNRNRILQNNKASYTKTRNRNSETFLEKKRKWYRAWILKEGNREKALAWGRKWRANNKEHRREQDKRSYWGSIDLLETKKALDELKKTLEGKNV